MTGRVCNERPQRGVGKALAVFALTAPLALLAAVPAGAAINPTRDSATAAAAISDLLAPATVTGSAFTTIPPTAQCANGIDDDSDGFTDFGSDPQCGSADDDDEGTPFTSVDLAGVNPAATADTPLTQFPTAGAGYAILSSGDSTLAGTPFANASVDNRGMFYPARDQGRSQLFDLVTLRVDLDVPADANCVQFEFRFLSQESTGLAASPFNDAFIAELDSSTFTVDPATQTLSAPNNFAFDEAGSAITVNSAGVNASNAAGTAYSGATELLIASAPVTPGAHSVFFSLYDAGDAIVDSAVFIDRLTAGSIPPGQCVTGARRSTPDPTQGETVNLRPVDGSVLVDIPGDDAGFIAIENAVQVPVGSKVDTRNGRVQLTSATDGGGGGEVGTSGAGGTQTAEFYGGVFQVKQGRQSDKTTVRLRGRQQCGGGARGGNRNPLASRKRKPKLWGSGSGNFSSQGNHGSASVRGTEWLLFEQCGGITGTTVKEGRVAFKNFYTRRTTIVTAGRTVLARPPGRR